MIKKLIKVLTVIAICCFSVFVFACNDGSQTKTPQENPIITLNSKSLSLVLGDSAQLQAEYSLQDWVSFVWQSSNTDIATVDENGKVYAVGVGETKVTVKYENLTAECYVIVGVGNYVPTLIKSHGFSNQITAYVGSEYQLSYSVLFNKHTYDNGVFSFESSDENFVSVDNDGKITVKQKTDDVITITVKGEWLGKQYPTLYEDIQVKVVEDVKILVDGGSLGKIKLYTLDEHNGQSYPTTKNLDVQVLHNGQNVGAEEYSVVLADGGDKVATYQDGKITSVAYGQTKLIISYGQFNKEIPIEIERPVSKYKGGLIDFSAYNGKLDLEEIFDRSNVQLLDAMQGDKTLTIIDNAIFGLSLERDKLTQTSVTLLDDKEGYIVDLSAAYARIKTAQDLSVLEIKSGTDKSDNVNGYVVLESDIVLNEPLSHTGVDTTGYNLSSKVGFAGVFDGNGFKITAPIDRAGFFGAMVANTEDAQTVIKNVRFDLTVQLSSGGRDNKDHVAGLFYLVGNMSAKNRMTLQDVFVRISGRVGEFSGICAYDSYCLDYKNVIVDLTDLIAQKGYVFGRVDGYVARGLFTARENIWVVSNLPFATTQTGLSNIPSNLTYYASNKYEGAVGTEYNVKEEIDNSIQYKINASGAKQYESYKQLYDVAGNILNVQISDGYNFQVEKVNLNVNEQTTASLTKSGNPKEFTLSSSNGCVTCVGNVIKANYDGSAIITATYEVDGVTHSKYLIICVGQGSLTVHNYNTQETPYTFSALDGEMPEDMLTGGESIIRAVADKQTLTVENGKIKGFILSVDGYGRDVATNSLISVYTDKSNVYKVYVTAYTKTIDSESDMLYFNLSEEKVLSGTYKMTQNVEITEQVASQITHQAVTKIGSVAYGFKGVFDGDGYTLSGYIPTKGYFGAMVYYGVIKNLAIDAVPYVTSGVENVVFAYAGGAGGNGSMPLTVTDVSVRLSGKVTTFAGLFGRSFAFITSNSLFVDLSELTASSGYVISSDVSTGYFKGTNIFAVSTLEIAKITHWRKGQFIASNIKIPEDVTMQQDGGHYYTLKGVNYWTFDQTADNSATNAKGILYSDYEQLLANQKTAHSYTGYGSTGAQFTNSTYWKITEMTVGGYTGFVPVWKSK